MKDTAALPNIVRASNSLVQNRNHRVRHRARVHQTPLERMQMPLFRAGRHVRILETHTREDARFLATSRTLGLMDDEGALPREIDLDFAGELPEDFPRGILQVGEDGRMAIHHAESDNSVMLFMPHKRTPWCLAKVPMGIITLKNAGCQTKEKPHQSMGQTS